MTKPGVKELKKAFNKKKQRQQVWPAPRGLSVCAVMMCTHKFSPLCTPRAESRPWRFLSKPHVEPST